MMNANTNVELARYIKNTGVREFLYTTGGLLQFIAALIGVGWAASGAPVPVALVVAFAVVNFYGSATNQLAAANTPVGKHAAVEHEVTTEG